MPMVAIIVCRGTCGVRGKCKTDCVRKADHVAYKQTALELLFQWCHEAYE